MSRASFASVAATFAASFVLAFALAALSDRSAAEAGDRGTTTAGTAGRAAPRAGERVTIPIRNVPQFGGDVDMTGQLYRPPGPGPFPVVIFSHGRPPAQADRERLWSGLSDAQIQYWLDRGDAVVAPIRPGYGATGGRDAESDGVHFDDAGACRSRPDYRSVAIVQRRTIEATIGWLRGQPWAEAKHVLLVGQSAGGLASVTAGAQAPDGVVGVVNFAGGLGGNPALSPGRSCDPEGMTRLYAELGRMTTLPTLWIYTRNDQYFGAEAPRTWHAAFARGGSHVTFVQAPAPADGAGDGHDLAERSPALWAPYVDAYLATIPFDRPPH